jgi:prevent-host-death family protein
MKQVSAREANQKFSKLLAEVAGGQEVVITKRGVPVARLVAVQGKAMDRKRAAAIKRMVAMMKKGVNLGGLRFKRDELYER